MRMCQRSVGFSESSFACSWRLGGRITRHIFTPTIRTMLGFSGSIPLSCLRRQPISIPPELSKLAEELELSYSETLTLLEAHEAVVARRAAKLLQPPTVDEWRKFYNAIKDVYSDVSGLEK